MSSRAPIDFPIVNNGGGGTLAIASGGTGATTAAAAAVAIVNGNPIAPSKIIASANGEASTPPALLNGTWFTGGTSTTTKPQVLIEPTGTTSTGWSTSGTGLGINAASGFAGQLIDAQIAGRSVVSVDASAKRLDIFAANVSAANYSKVYITDIFIGRAAAGASDTNQTLTISAGNGPMAIRASANMQLFAGDDLMLHLSGNTLPKARLKNNGFFDVYNTYVSTTNFESITFGYKSASSAFCIGTEKGSGGGTARPLEIITDGTARLTIDALGRIIPVLPTSAAGLPTGALWNDAGTVKVA